MERRIIGDPLDRKNRNYHNENYEYLFGKLHDTLTQIKNEINQDVLDEIIRESRVNWLNAVETEDDLPTVANVGDAVFVTENNKAYRFDGDNWIYFQALDSSAVNALKVALDDEINDITEKQNNKINEINGLTDDPINIYVDASYSGGESNGSPSNPFKTIQEAVDSIPKIINKDRIIKVRNGTYNEDVVVQSINGAAIVIERAQGIVDASVGSTGFKVRSLSFFDCGGLLRVNNAESINAHLIGGKAFIRFSRCYYGTAHALRCVDSRIAVNTVEFDGSNGSLNSCYFNSQNKILISKNGSSVRIDSTNSHGSTPSGTGVEVDAGSVFFNGNNNWLRNTDNETSSIRGGVINKDYQQIDLKNYLGANWQEYLPDGPNKPTATKVNGFVQLNGLIKDGDVGPGKIAVSLPVGWRPLSNNIYASPLSSGGETSKVLVDTEGSIAVEKHSGQYVSLGDIPLFYAGN